MKTRKCKLLEIEKVICQNFSFDIAIRGTSGKGVLEKDIHAFLKMLNKLEKDLISIGGTITPVKARANVL